MHASIVLQIEPKSICFLNFNILGMKMLCQPAIEFEKFDHRKAMDSVSERSSAAFSENEPNGSFVATESLQP